MKRVVITGAGLVTPYGDGLEASWQGVLSSRSAITAITRFDVGNLPVRIAGMVPWKSENPEHPHAFDPDAYMSPKDQRKIDMFITYAIAAAEQAVRDAGIKAENSDHAERIGVMVGSGIGGLPLISDTAHTLRDQGARRISPFFIPASLINLASGHISIRHGFKGPNHAVVTACATGAHAIGDAARLIQFGDADVMVAGGAEAAVCPLGIAGFAAARALASGFNDNPEKASRPWDRDREGFVMGEGAGIVVLESLEHALARGANIYGEIAGYGLSGDAYHITSPAEDGDGAFRAMRNALNRAGLKPEDVDYINAHGTSTPAGDGIEVTAVKRLFGDHAYKIGMSSTKSSIGHLLGAAGSVEAIFSLLAMRDGIMPPTLNLDNPSEGCDMNFVAHTPQKKDLNAVMSNSFGFGGTNASLVFKKYQA